MRERYGPWALVAGASEGVGAAYARALITESAFTSLADMGERDRMYSAFPLKLLMTERTQLAADGLLGRGLRERGRHRLKGLPAHMLFGEA